MPHTLLFDRSDRTRLQLSGPHAVATLNGLVTNDVAALAPGRGAYAAALTPKGKMVADLRIFMGADGPLVDVSPRASRALRDMFAKYVNPRFATVTDVTSRLGDVGVFGADAAAAVASATKTPGSAAAVLTALGAYDSVACEHEGRAILIARVPDLGVDGYELFIPRDGVDALRAALLSAGVGTGDEPTWHVLRVAAGRPEWGIDMDEHTLPQEANLDALHGVSYDKGCYVGQETVARIHFRGHVNRTLRRLAVDGDLEPPAGSVLVDDDGKLVGDVRSTAVLAASATAVASSSVIGIGMVRHEVQDGAPLTVRWEGGTAPVRVVGPADGNAKGATN